MESEKGQEPDETGWNAMNELVAPHLKSLLASCKSKAGRANPFRSD